MEASPPSPRATFAQIAELFCQAKRPLLKHSSMCAYRLALRTHLLPHFGGMRTVGEADAQRFIIGKVEAGMARKTVRDLMGLLRSIVRFGARRGLCQAPDWQLEYPPADGGRRLPILSLAHQRRLTDHLTQQPDPRGIGILLALMAGLRIGEVCALTWHDVDLTQRVLRVRQTAGRIYNCDLGTTERVISSPKTPHSYREVPLAEPLRNALRALRPSGGGGYVVGAPDRPEDPRSYRAYFARLLRRLKIPPIVFHGLRHTFATRCIESQCDQKTVSVMLGHADVSTTLNLYVHPNLEQKRRCIDRMSRFAAAPRAHR